MKKLWWIVGLVLLIGLVLGCTGGEDKEPEWRVPSQAPVSVEKTPGHITQPGI